ncbi:MAG: RNA-binding S4 domain-containing protein [Planctomycetaceae bacterium]|nr:RNA-binding S4 domain-containing protein [Planctomycetaceae bacterium]
MTGSDPLREPIRLDQFLKFNDIATTGGHAKMLIQNGEVRVNGQVETRRGRKLAIGDLVEIDGEQFSVTSL